VTGDGTGLIHVRPNQIFIAPNTTIESSLLVYQGGTTQFPDITTILAGTQFHFEGEVCASELHILKLKRHQ
jgi:hypothetical protein